MGCYLLGRLFCNGLARDYYRDYDLDVLGPYISKDDYEKILKEVSIVLRTNWPCDVIHYVSILTCIPTLG